MKKYGGKSWKEKRSCLGCTRIGCVLHFCCVAAIRPRAKCRLHLPQNIFAIFIWRVLEYISRKPNYMFEICSCEVVLLRCVLPNILSCCGFFGAFGRHGCTTSFCVCVGLFFSVLVFNRVFRDCRKAAGWVNVETFASWSRGAVAIVLIIEQLR